MSEQPGAVPHPPSEPGAQPHGHPAEPFERPLGPDHSAEALLAGSVSPESESGREARHAVASARDGDVVHDAGGNGDAVSTAHGSGTAAEREPSDAAVDPPGNGGRSTRRTLLRGTALQTVGQLAPLVVNIVMTPFVITGLSPEIYAIFLLVSVLQTFMQMIDGGIGPSASRYFTVYAGVDDRVATTRLLVTLGAIITAMTVVVFALFFAVTPQILSFFPVTQADPEGSTFLMRVMVVLAAFAQIRGLFAFVLFANQRFGIMTVMGLASYVAYAIGLVWTVEHGWGLDGIAWVFVAQQVVSTVFIIPSACRFLTRRGLGFVSRDLLREFFSYSWKQQLSSVLYVIATSGDMLIVNRLRPAQAAAFGPGSTFAQQLRMVPLNAYAPIHSTVGRAVGADGPAGALATFERIQRPWVIAVTGWVAVGAPAAYFGVTSWLYTALGSDLPGVVAAVLLVGHLFWLISNVQLIWPLAVGRSDIELRYGVIGLLLNIVGTIALIIPFGVVGSVLATTAAQLVASLALDRIMSRSLSVAPGAAWRHIPVLPTIVAVLLSFAGTWATSRLVGGLVPYGGLGLIVTGLGAAPALVVYAVWALGLDQLRDLAAKKFPRLARG